MFLLLRRLLFQNVILILTSLQGVVYVGQLCRRYRFRISRSNITNWTYQFAIDNECARKTLTFTSNPFSKQKLCKSLVVNYSLQFTACVSSDVPPVRALDSAVQWPELPPVYQWIKEWSGNFRFSFRDTAFLKMGSLEGKPAKSGQIRKFVGGEFIKKIRHQRCM